MLAGSPVVEESPQQCSQLHATSDVSAAQRMLLLCAALSNRRFSPSLIECVVLYSGSCEEQLLATVPACARGDVKIVTIHNCGLQSLHSPEHDGVATPGPIATCSDLWAPPRFVLTEMKEVVQISLLHVAQKTCVALHRDVFAHPSSPQGSWRNWIPRERSDEHVVCSPSLLLEAAALGCEACVVDLLDALTMASATSNASLQAFPAHPLCRASRELTVGDAFRALFHSEFVLGSVKHSSVQVVVGPAFPRSALHEALRHRHESVAMTLVSWIVSTYLLCAAAKSSESPSTNPSQLRGDEILKLLRSVDGQRDNVLHASIKNGQVSFVEHMMDVIQLHRKALIELAAIYRLGVNELSESRTVGPLGYGEFVVRQQTNERHRMYSAAECSISSLSSPPNAERVLAMMSALSDLESTIASLFLESNVAGLRPLHVLASTPPVSVASAGSRRSSTNRHAESGDDDRDTASTTLSEAAAVAGSVEGHEMVDAVVHLLRLTLATHLLLASSKSRSEQDVLRVFLQSINDPARGPLYSRFLALGVLEVPGIGGDVFSTASVDAPIHLAARCGNARFLHYVFSLFSMCPYVSEHQGVRASTSECKIPSDILEHRNPIGATAVWLAAAKGSTECCRLLLKHGARSNTTTPRWGSAIEVAVRNGHRGAVRELVEYGADITAKLCSYAARYDAIPRVGDERSTVLDILDAYRPRLTDEEHRRQPAAILLRDGYVVVFIVLLCCCTLASDLLPRFVAYLNTTF